MGERRNPLRLGCLNFRDPENAERLAGRIVSERVGFGKKTVSGGKKGRLRQRGPPNL